MQPQETKSLTFTQGNQTQSVEFVAPPANIPADKLKQMQVYALDLIRKHPDWKLHKVQRKTCEYFKVNVIDEKSSAENTAREDQ